ncbi:hypothetical protein L218DRAFT_299537 [Marasmius fiardii PR-910]|nr:hypothetical protein L218DRAFT_299537 [Marasmius fiardii PR-910]
MDHNRPLLCGRCQRPVEAILRPMQPVDPHLLRATRSLSAEEKSHMNCLLEEENSLIQEYEEEINQIRQRLATLEEAKRALEDNVAKRRSTLAVLRTLPSEIWLMIFTIFGPQNHELRPCTPYYHSVVAAGSLLETPPLLLSHVCSRWRAIVFDCPKLWSSIRVNLDAVPGDSHHLFLLYAERSMGWPLDLKLSSYTSLATRHTLDLWKVVTEHISWCRTLKLDYDVCDIFERAPVVRDVSFPYLISFHGRPFPEDVNTSLWFWKALRQSPMLTKVETTHLYPLDSLPYSQLTAITIRLFMSSDDSLQSFIQTLRISKNLCYLTLDVEEETWALDNLEPHRYSAVEMMRLRSFKIRPNHSFLPSLESSYTLKVLCTYLLMPALETFELACSVVETSDRWPEPLRNMLRHCSLLSRLSLQFHGCYDPGFDPKESLSTLLRVTPGLTHLELRMWFNGYSRFRDVCKENTSHASAFFSSLLSDLKHISHRPILLPRLEHLSLRISDAILDDHTLAELLGTVQTRTPKDLGLPLKNIHVQRFSPRSYNPSSMRKVPRPSIPSEIERLQQDGVYVTIEDAMDAEYEYRDEFEEE